MTQGLVSIVIPTYNDDPAHLAEAVASARAQTWPDVEVVVVDDGSDVPVQLDGVRVIRQDNAGPAAARNTGIRATPGELVLPLDADDRISPGYVSACVTTLRGDRRARAAQPGRMEAFGLGEQVHQPPVAVDLGHIIHTNAVLQSAMFYRADWERLGGYDEGLRVGFEDYEWWVRLLAHRGGRVRRADGAVLHYRIREGSRSSDDVRTAHDATRAAIRANNPGHALLRARAMNKVRRAVRATR